MQVRQTQNIQQFYYSSVISVGVLASHHTFVCEYTIMMKAVVEKKEIFNYKIFGKNRCSEGKG